MKVLFGLFSIFFVSGAVAETVYYSVKCVGNQDAIEMKWLIGDKSSVVITSENKILVKGTGLDLRDESRPKVKQCSHQYGNYCKWFQDPFGGGEEICGYKYTREWNVKVLRRTGGESLFYCGVGSEVESFTDRAAWLGKIFASHHGVNGKHTIEKRECVIDEAG